MERSGTTISTQWGANYSCHSGASGDSASAGVIFVDSGLAEQRVPHSMIATWDGERWNPATRVGWSAVGIAQASVPSVEWIAVGANGEAVSVSAGGARPETLGAGEVSPRDIGLMTRVKAIDGKLFAVGMCRQVYRRDGPDVWRRVDQGVRRSPGDTSVVGFKGIDGFSQHELYGAGWRGEVWLLEDAAWRQIASPTNLILTDVCCAPDGHVYICGRRGMLLKGRRDQWSIVENALTRQDFWGVAWHEGRVYVATMQALAVLDGDRLAWAAPEDDAPDTAYHLSTNGTLLWSFGPRGIFVFDGRDWTQFD